MERIDHRIEAIEQDAVNGATFLTAQAVGVLGDAVSACKEAPDWADCLSDTARRLAVAKPTMVALRNATDMLLEGLLAMGSDEAQRRSQDLVGRLLARIRSAAQDAAASAASLIPENATVITCSYSSAILRTMRKARDETGIKEALVLEPDATPQTPGRRLAAELENMGISSQIFSTVSDRRIASAQLALLGADAVTPAFVVNGTPSLVLAQASRGLMPLYVVCETIKFAQEAGVEPGFDSVPLRLVTGIATEGGILPPEDVAGRIEHGLKGWLRLP